MNLFMLSLSFIVTLGVATFLLALKRKALKTFGTHEVVVIALFCSLLYVAGIPFRMGLSRIPFVHAFIFSIPFTAVLFIGIRIVPRLGTATLIVLGHSLLSQLIARGLNPLWWPYALLAGFVLEAYFLITRSYLGTAMNALAAGMLRGLVMYLYFYLFSAPCIWHIHYAPWYVFIQTAQGVAGSGVGALIGFALSKPIMAGYRRCGI